MLIFNLRGLLGMLIGGAVAWAVITVYPAQLATEYELSYGLLIALLVSSLYALSIDRSDRRGLWQSYRVSCITFYNPVFGQPIPGDVGLNHDRRLAVFCWPLAIGSTILLVVALITWAIDRASQSHLASSSQFGWYASASFAAALMTLVYAWLTRDLRFIPGSLPAPSSPSIEVEPTTIAGVVGAAIRGGSLPEAPSRAPGAAIVLIGAAGLAFNHFQSLSKELSLLILMACPFLILMGMGTLIDARVLWSIRGEGRIYPRWIRVLGAILTLAGFAISGLLIFVVYRGKL